MSCTHDADQAGSPVCADGRGGWTGEVTAQHPQGGLLSSYTFATIAWPVAYVRSRYRRARAAGVETGPPVLS